MEFLTLKDMAERHMTLINDGRMSRLRASLVVWLLLLSGMFWVACAPPGGVATQPPPPAVAADLERILAPQQPECAVRCTELGESYEKCSAAICAPGLFPQLVIRALDSAAKQPGQALEIAGQFGQAAEELSLALAEERGGALYHRYRLRVLSWENDRIAAQIHEQVAPGAYQLLLVYQMNVGQAVRPIFMRASNTAALEVREP
jgi:hypothetical protein